MNVLSIIVSFIWMFMMVFYFFINIKYGICNLVFILVLIIFSRIVKRDLKKIQEEKTLLSEKEIEIIMKDYKTRKIK